MYTKQQIAAYSAIIAIGVGSGAQSAETLNEDVSVKVTYTDLNTSTPAGAKALLHRIHYAAEQACGPEDGIENISRPFEAAHCVGQATADAVARVNDPMVTALYQGRNAPDAIVVAKAR